MNKNLNCILILFCFLACQPNLDQSEQKEKDVLRVWFAIENLPFANEAIGQYEIAQPIGDMILYDRIGSLNREEVNMKSLSSPIMFLGTNSACLSGSRNSTWTMNISFVHENLPPPKPWYLIETAYYPDDSYSTRSKRVGTTGMQIANCKIGSTMIGSYQLKKIPGYKEYSDNFFNGELEITDFSYFEDFSKKTVLSNNKTASEIDHVFEARYTIQSKNLTHGSMPFDASLNLIYKGKIGYKTEQSRDSYWDTFGRVNYKISGTVNGSPVLASYSIP
ncbi:hypothetical protein EHQ72_18045, partial [Leptospira yasudae]